MAYRHFPEMVMNWDLFHPHVNDSDDEQEQNRTLPEPGSENYLFLLRHTAYDIVAERFKVAALELKNETVARTWGELNGQKVGDFSLYSGVLGTAFLLFKSFQVTNDEKDLGLSSEIIKACDSASLDSRDVTFIRGRAGVCALGAVVAKFMEDDKLMNSYLIKFKEIELPEDLPDGLLDGRAGYLWACLFINKYLGEGTISSIVMDPVIEQIFINGKKLGGKGGSPLMFQWNGKKYWGAAHGLAGILHVLMHCKLNIYQLADVAYSLLYMFNNRFPSANFRTCEEDESDVLVQWCLGAPGIALTLVKACETFWEGNFMRGGVDAVFFLIWERGLLRHVGLCHGISGNAYVFGSIYRITKVRTYRFLAKSFACFLLEEAQKLLSNGQMRGGDHPYSLFEGIGGMACLFLDLAYQPENVKFPAYDL